MSEDLALQGYDPVAYFLDGVARPGRDDVSYVHDGRLYRFASSDDRARFIAEPERYRPQYDGFCALGVAEGHKAAADPVAFAVIEGKLYLNYDQETAGEWRRDIAGNIAKADAHWTTPGALAAEE